MSRLLTIIASIILLFACVGVSAHRDNTGVFQQKFINKKQSSHNNKVGTPLTLWKTTIAGSPSITATPYADNQNLFLSTSNLVNLNRYTGALNWTSSTASSTSLVNQVYADAVIAASKVALFYGDSNGMLWNVDLTSGATDYNFNCSSDPIMTRAVVYGINNVITATFGGDVFSFGLSCCQPGGGSQAWNYSLGDFVTANPLLTKSDDGVTDILIVASHGGYIVGLDAATGKELWKTRTTKNAAILQSCNIDGSRKMYCATQSGEVFRLNTTNGSFDWKVRVNGAAAAGIVLSADQSTLYFPGHFTKVYGISTASGSVVFTFDNKNNYLLTGVAVNPLNGNVIFGTNNAGAPTLVAIDGQTGAEYWRFVGDASSGAISTGIFVDTKAIFFATQSGDVYSLKNE